MSKQLPIRLFIVGVAAGGAGLYYLVKHNEINRVRRMKFSIDMMINVTLRAAAASVAAEVLSRKLFVNYQRL